MSPLRLLRPLAAIALAVSTIAVFPRAAVVEAAGKAPPAVTVTITEGGYTPSSVTIGIGGTVTWVNKGRQVHTATAVPGVGAAFDTGGLAPGQQQAITFTAPGTFPYRSQTDTGTAIQGVVTVLNRPPTVSVQDQMAALQAAGSLGPGQATVNISSTGLDNYTVTISACGTVTWNNNDTVLHTATSDPNAGYNAFDTGGIAPNGGSQSIGFQFPGTYTYHSETDPKSGAIFRGTVVVTQGPPGCQ